MSDIQRQLESIGLTKLEREAIIEVKPNGWDLRYLEEVMHDYACTFPPESMVIQIERTLIDNPPTYIAKFYRKEEK